jgi:maleate isomerase
VTNQPSLERHPLLTPEHTSDAITDALGIPNEPPTGPVSVGVIAPYDFALDRELWRWVPDIATLHLTRTPFSPLPVTLEQAVLVSDTSVVARCAAEVVTVRPEVIAYACTSGSFVGGVAGERALVASMIEAGAPAAVTVSGALLEALHHVGARRVAVATPYDAAITERLHTFLADSGVEVVGSSHLGLSGRIWTVPYAATVRLAREAAVQGCEALFLSCTNLPTYDVIGPLEQELGVPVLTANQVLMWAALRRAGLDAVAEGQRLLADATEGASA